MVDADVVGSKLPEGQTRHWLVNGVTISGTLSYCCPTSINTRNKGSTIANSSATAITSYAGPWPASGSGPHRCVTYSLVLGSMLTTLPATLWSSMPSHPPLRHQLPIRNPTSLSGPLISTHMLRFVTPRLVDCFKLLTTQ